MIESKLKKTCKRLFTSIKYGSSRKINYPQEGKPLLITKNLILNLQVAKINNKIKI